MFLEYFEKNYQKELSACSRHEVYTALLSFVKEQLSERGYYQAKKKLY